jgi:hypothetical protein
MGKFIASWGVGTFWVCLSQNIPTLFIQQYSTYVHSNQDKICFCHVTPWGWLSLPDQQIWHNIVFRMWCILDVTNHIHTYPSRPVQDSSEKLMANFRLICPIKPGCSSHEPKKYLVTMGPIFFDVTQVIEFPPKSDGSLETIKSNGFLVADGLWLPSCPQQKETPQSPGNLPSGSFWMPLSSSTPAMRLKILSS